MNSVDRWAPGSHIVFRQVWFNKIWAAFPVTVVEDSADRTTVHIAPGADFMAPNCDRAEYLRVLASKKWRLTQHTWSDEPMLWSTAPGEACSVWTIWQGENWHHSGWKVNPEAPWTRTRVGFDTTDHVLDAVVEPDLVTWSWKDADELSEAVQLELFTTEKAAAVRKEAQRVLARMVDRGQEEAKQWANWRPKSNWMIPMLGPAWSKSDVLIGSFESIRLGRSGGNLRVTARCCAAAPLAPWPSATPRQARGSQTGETLDETD